MRKKEQKAWDNMRKHVGPHARLERIENMVSVGIPDVLACAESRVTFCELKAVDGWPVREATRVLGREGLSQDQKNWHLDWRRWGGKSIIVVRVGQEIFAFPGSEADYVNEYNTAQFRAAAFAHSWEEIINYLRTHEL